MSEEPTGAVSVLEAKEAASNASVEANTTTPSNASQELVIVGRIAAGEHTPWDEHRAVFLITDASMVLDGAEHCHHGDGDHSDCPFCNKDKSVTDTLAIVQCEDEQGEVIPLDARKLLGLTDEQLVVVRGLGKVDQLGNLIISALGIYVRE